MTALRKLSRRLKSKKGESLVEAMASILVFTLSSILLLSMISSASNINEAAQKYDENRIADLSAAEAGLLNGSTEETGAISSATVILDYTFSSQITTERLPVHLFQKPKAEGQQTEPLYSYFQYDPNAEE